MIVTPRRVDRMAKRRQIIEAAARVFARRGLGASTMSQIAAVAEVGKGTLYEYFPSKRSLILAVFDDLHHSLLEEGRARFAGEGAKPPAAARLRGFFELLLDAGESMRELLPLWMEMWAAASTEALRQELGYKMRALYHDFRELLAGIFRDGQASGELRAGLNPEWISASLVGGLDGLFLQAWLDDEFPLARAGNHFIECALVGFLAAPNPAEQGGAAT
jgi:AcrR family transcriptional regulator